MVWETIYYESKTIIYVSAPKPYSLGEGNAGIGEPHRTPGSHTGKPVRTKGDAGPREATKGSHGAHQGRPRAAGKSQMEATKGRSAPRTAPGHREATKGSYKGKPRGTKDAPGRREATKGSHTRKPRDTKDAPGHRGTTKRSHGAPRTPRATGKPQREATGQGNPQKDAKTGSHGASRTPRATGKPQKEATGHQPKVDLATTTNLRTRLRLQ